MLKENNNKTFKMTVEVKKDNDIIDKIVKEDVGNIGFMCLRIEMSRILDELKKKHKTKHLNVKAVYEVADTGKENYKLFDTDVIVY